MLFYIFGLDYIVYFRRGSGQIQWIFQKIKKGGYKLSLTASFPDFLLSNNYIFNLLCIHLEIFYANTKSIKKI